MSEVSSSGPTMELAKPVEPSDAIILPPFPEPGDGDFDDDIGGEEREYYKSKYKDLNRVKTERLHCSACDRHMGCAAKNESRMRSHPMLRTLMCHTCHTFYNSGEFEKGDDGSELYCRWCGQGGQVYCCSDCPHVFCAKCIKRNLGVQKIHEIESTDDWKCLKCCPRDLWDLRALCWALLRFCDLKNKLVYKTEDPDLKEKYQKDCALDSSDCCRDKRRRGFKKKEEIKKDVKTEPDIKKVASSLISKIPQGIQVKKFASINAVISKPEKKPIKRVASPKMKPTMIKNPIQIHNHMPSNMFQNFQVPMKKMRMSSPMAQPSPANPFGIDKNRQFVQYTARIRPKPPQQLNPYPIPVMPSFNGYNSMMSDNINLSLESLTQGLDMAAVAGVNNDSNKGVNNELVCTPDFPLEPMCEVTEDNDDDVECITPAPVAAPRPPAPILVKKQNSLPPIASENIVQMTENDVTVNAVTGGLKFRVDPQTLSSNKMYRLPDGRVFAINSNPNMPGGYSATIVAVTENNSVSTPKSASKGATYAAKLCTVSSSKVNSTPPPLAKVTRNNNRILNKPQRNTPSVSKATKGNDTSARKLDMDVPVEWYRFNLVDAYDSLEYSLSRLRKLKREATTMHLRGRSLDEMRALHKTLDRLLHNSASRFNEIRDNLSKGMKQFVMRKSGVEISDDDDAEDDDDVEILNENDDPIFIDENSMESNNASKDNYNQEVDLVSSDLNDSGEKEAMSVNNLNATAESNGALEDSSSAENVDVSITKNNKLNDDKLQSTELMSKEALISDNDMLVDQITNSEKRGSPDAADTDDVEVTARNLDRNYIQANVDKDFEIKEDVQKDNDDEHETDKVNEPKETDIVKEDTQNDNSEKPEVAEEPPKDQKNEEHVANQSDNEDIDKESNDQNNEKSLLKDDEGPDKVNSQDNEMSDELINTLLFDAGDDVSMENMPSANLSEPDSILP